MRHLPLTTFRQCVARYAGEHFEWLHSHKGFPVPLRRIKYIDPKTHKRLVFLTNQFGLARIENQNLNTVPT